MNHLTKKFGDRIAVDQVSFSIQPGEIVGFLGPNGAGKSTVLKMMAGFWAPTSGEVLYSGKSLATNPIVCKKNIGYLPEVLPLYGEMSVRSYLKYVGQLRGVSKEELDSSVKEVLALTSIEKFSGRLISNLSKGYKQRVGLAASLLGHPQVLLLDEPLSGLDPAQLVEFRELFLSLKGKHTVLLSSHLLSEIQSVCDRVVIINEGKIVGCHSVQQLQKEILEEVKLEVEVARNVDKLVQILEEKDGVFIKKKQGLKFEISINQEEIDIEEVSLLVAQSGCGLISFKSSEHRLEDLFLGATTTIENQNRATQ